MSFALLPLAAPLLFIAAMVAAYASPARRPAYLGAISQAAALGAVAVSITSLAYLFTHEAQTSLLLGVGGVGLSVRLDVISTTMALLVSFVGWVVLRYSSSYLDGEARQGPFLGSMSGTLAAVLLLVLSGNLVMLCVSWVVTSLALHKLLLFFPRRPAAIRAARKKFFFARAGDVALVGAAFMLFLAFDSLDIATILAAAQSMETPPAAAIGAVALLAVAALLKSAQFPTHGWLTEMMETPTPVSALLHAGIVNAGGFLLIRFADVMLLSPSVLAVVAIIGGFTALFGSVVMLTQSAVKTSLAWSTVAQMGFMTLQCGLALFPLALLHIVAHSLYKAHAFLSSGDAVENVTSIRRPGPIAIPGFRAVGLSFALALAIYTVLGLVFGFDGKSPQAVALGGILILGIAYLIAQGLADQAPRMLAVRISFYVVAASVSYFLLQSWSAWLTRNALPATPAPGPLEWALIVLAIFSFGFVAFAQSLSPLWSNHPAVAGLRVHFANGFYMNATFDRLLGAWRPRNIDDSSSR